MTTAKWYKAMDAVTLEHARICGATITQYDMNPTDFNRLRLEEDETYRGAAVCANVDVPKGCIRVICTDGHGTPLGEMHTDGGINYEVKMEVVR